MKHQVYNLTVKFTFIGDPIFINPRRLTQRCKILQKTKKMCFNYRPKTVLNVFLLVSN